MNLLPKSSTEFSSSSYWNEFFSKRGLKAFDWYGEYTELCGHLHKYIRTSDKVLVAGCGNSTISADLYKVGYNEITNIDISEVVISQMKEKYNILCPNMKWECGNLLDLHFKDGIFSSILDKGTLDALMSEESTENSMHLKYFEEIHRVMKTGGRYVCISLLQEHILKALLDWFPENGWIMRFTRCIDAETNREDKETFSFPVFVVICTKFKKMTSFSPIMELSFNEAGDIRRAKDSSEVQNAIVSLQQYSILSHNLRNKTVSDDTNMNVELCDAKSGAVRYRIFIVDSPKVSNGLKFAIFIVPPGRESEWLFNSHEGQLQLADSASSNRLAIVHLMRDQSYGDLEDIQNELSDKVLELAPAKLKPKKNSKIPFLSVGRDLGERKEVFRGRSSFSGEFVIEDVSNDSDDFTLRRLIFMNNQNVIQSEAKLVRNRKSRKLKIDHLYLSCTHHSLMVASVSLVSASSCVLVVGLGGGALPTFIHNNFPQSTTVAVDIDEAIFTAAKDFYDFNTTDKLKCHIDDGVHFIEKAANEGTAYDVVMFDVDSKEVGVGLSCPPQNFLSIDFLNKVATCLNDKGLLVVNLVCRDKALKKVVIDDLKGIFHSIMCISVPEEVNEVLYCSKTTNNKWDIETKFKDLNQYFKNKFKTRDVFIDFRDIVNKINYL